MLVNRPRGFTLAEALVCIAILGILATMAAPVFTGILERQRVALLADRFAASLATARATAMAQRRPVMVSPLQPASGWAGGWQICIDLDNDQACGPTDPTVARTNAARSNVVLHLTSSVSADDIRFAPVGYSRRKTGGFVSGTMRISSGQAVKLVTLSAQGRVRICDPASERACGNEA